MKCTKIKATFLVCCSLILFFSCTSSSPTHEDAALDTYFTKEAQDSLMADLATYLYVRPQGVRRMEQFDIKHRAYYIKNSSKFEIDKLYQENDSSYYFFILRPARHAKFNQRGVGGIFTYKQGKIVDFEEIYNTPVMEKEAVLLKGRALFQAMLKDKTIEKYIGNKEYLEWPDGRSRYDKSIYEWVYR